MGVGVFEKDLDEKHHYRTSAHSLLNFVTVNTTPTDRYQTLESAILVICN